MAETNPVVRLRHEGLDRTTSQPLSAARHLLNSGWAADDQQSADLLGVKFEKGSRTSDSASSSKTTRSTSTSSTSKSNTSKSDDK